MSTMHRRLIAVALAVAALALPAYAQRGGGARGGSGGFAAHSSGFASHSAPVSHSSFSSVGRTSFMGAPQVSSRYTSARPYPQTLGRVSGVGTPGRRPGDNRDNRYRRPYLPVYGVGIPYSVGYVGPGFYDSYDPAYYDNSTYAAPTPLADYPPADYPGGYGPPSDYQADVVPPSFRPPYQKPQPEPEPEAAVTLIFKDGRPTEQIHNYMLTRTTLYVQDEKQAQRLREVPLDQLDLTAMDKVNREAGVDFRPPSAAR
jgi:hypothetical protein